MNTHTHTWVKDHNTQSLPNTYIEIQKFKSHLLDMANFLAFALQQ